MTSRLIPQGSSASLLADTLGDWEAGWWRHISSSNAIGGLLQPRTGLSTIKASRGPFWKMQQMGVLCLWRAGSKAQGEKGACSTSYTESGTGLSWEPRVLPPKLGLLSFDGAATNKHAVSPSPSPHPHISLSMLPVGALWSSHAWGRCPVRAGGALEIRLSQP